MIRQFVVLLLGLTVSFASSAQARNAILDTIAFSKRQYTIGTAISYRYSPLDLSFGPEQGCWCLPGIGLSVARYVKDGSARDRAFWIADIGYSTETVNQRRVIDLRFLSNPPPGSQNIVEVGTKTEQWNYHYISVPLSFNYLVFNTERTNLYVAGEASFEWLFYYRLEREATYDGRTNIVRNARFKDVSATLGLGAGLYQPIDPHFTLLIGFYRGHTFFSDFDKVTNLRRNNGISQLSLRLHYKITH